VFLQFVHTHCQVSLDDLSASSLYTTYFSKKRIFSERARSERVRPDLRALPDLRPLLTLLATAAVAARQQPILKQQQHPSHHTQVQSQRASEGAREGESEGEREREERECEVDDDLLYMEESDYWMLATDNDLDDNNIDSSDSDNLDHGQHNPGGEEDVTEREGVQQHA
jgi:hypothetical protein